jgi:polyisoprenoid-binding protein YceI
VKLWSSSVAIGGIYAHRIPRLDPDNATLSVYTKRGGAAAKAGHDLELHVTRWEATLDLDAGSAELTADGGSLRVQKGTGGMQALGEEDKANIHQTIDDEVLAKQNITFRSTSITGEDGRYRVEGELTLAGSTQPLSFDLIVDGDAISATATVTQTRFGMKPFSALFGTLKVLDDVEVRLQSL